MTIETNRDQAATLIRLAADDVRDGFFVSAKEHLTDAFAFVDQLAFEQSLASLDRKIRGMDSEDIETMLAGASIK